MEILLLMIYSESYKNDELEVPYYLELCRLEIATAFDFSLSRNRII